MVTDAGDDPSLVRRLRAGEPAAFEQVVREQTGRMLAVARRLLPREEDAQDAVQEAFMSAFRSLAGFEGESRLSTWLHRIVVNACLMRLRSMRRRPETSIDGLFPRFDDSGHHDRMPVRWSEPPADAVDRGEMLAEIRATILELPAEFRDVILLRDIEQVDTRSAAEMLGISAGAVKTRLHRARLALRGALETRLATRRNRESAARDRWPWARRGTNRTAGDTTMEEGR